MVNRRAIRVKHLRSKRESGRDAGAVRQALWPHHQRDNISSVFVEYALFLGDSVV